jgi:hypothetical protein
MIPDVSVLVGVALFALFAWACLTNSRNNASALSARASVSASGSSGCGLGPDNR